MELEDLQEWVRAIKQGEYTLEKPPVNLIVKWVQNGTNKQAFAKVKREVVKTEAPDSKPPVTGSVAPVYNFYGNVEVKGDEELLRTTIAA